jgi:hypothetical protein
MFVVTVVEITAIDPGVTVDAVLLTLIVGDNDVDSNIIVPAAFNNGRTVPDGIVDTVNVVSDGIVAT